MDLSNLNCVVTGASSGIGRKISLNLATRGCLVVAVARDAEKLEQLVNESTKLKGTIRPLVFDLQNFDEYEYLKEQIKSKISDIDLLINNAARGHSQEFSNQTNDNIFTVLNTTLIAPVLFTKACLPLMRKGSSAIVFVSSLAGKMGFPGLSVYSAAKHGIEGFADTIAQELESDVKVFVFRPGVTETRFFKNAGMDAFEEKAKNEGLMKSAQEVALEMMRVLEKDIKEYTVGKDRFLIPVLPWLSRHRRFTVLKYLNILNRSSK